MSMPELEQRTPDEVWVRVAANVGSVEAAFAWIVSQIDRRGLRDVQFSCSPVWGTGVLPPFDAENPGPHECPAAERWYEVWVAGTPAP